MKLNAIKLSALLLMSVPAGEATAQRLIHNQYPCAECAVFDNNGTDLRGFINSNKSSLQSEGRKVNEFSNNTWGYVQVKNIQVPSMDKQGNLNYYEAMDVTLALHKTDEGADATWIARETNAQQGPLVYIKTNDEGKLASRISNTPRLQKNWSLRNSRWSNTSMIPTTTAIMMFCSATTSLLKTAP